MAKSKNECFESVKRLLVEESWTHLDEVSNLVCNLLDDSLRLACEKDVSHGHASPILGVDERKEVAALFFAFVKYFATSLTRKSVRRDYGDPETNDTSTLNESVFNTTKVRTPQTQGKASSSHMQSVPFSFSFPPIRELWRQPSLIAAMERLAEVIWKIQVNVHNGESNVEDSSVGRCPLCYAASIENVIGTDAIWSLLEFYVAYRLAEGLSSDKEETKMNANRVDYSVNKSYDTMITLDVYTRQLLWTHAIAVCRNAIWNGAVQTLCLSVKEWLYAGTHPLLFAMVVVSPHGEGSVGLEVGKDIFTSRSFFLIQMCLLIQDEVMFEMEAIDARVKSDPFCKDQKKQKKNEDTSSVIIEKGHSKENTNNDTINDDDGVLSQVSSLTLRERGDVELHDSLFTLREMARVTGNMTAFAALTTTTPHYVMDGMTLLDWVCEKGYECCVRLLLSTWVKAYRDVRLLPDAAMGAEESVEEKRLRVNFAETLEKDLPKEVKKLTNVASKAVRCTVLQSNATVLPHAVQSGNVSIVRQLFLYGASRHQWDGGEPENKEMFAVLCNPGSVLDRTVGELHERTREALCATAASDALANAAWRLWSEKVRNLILSKWANSEEEAEYKRSHDSIMRTSLAALEFDPHNPLARKTLRDVLARKVIDSRTLNIATCGGDAALQQKRYYVTARRMCEQLLMTHTQREREKEIESVLESLPFASGAPEMRKTTMTSDNLFFLSSSSTDGGGDVSGGGGSPATIATDEQQRPVYALVNLIDTMESGTTNPTAMMHPLWVRLPCGVNVQRSFELVGGLYGVVESVLPLHAPVECGDLVLFALRQKFFRFDVTRVVRPRDGVVVEVPCVLEGSKDKVKTSVLRCAVVPTPVYNFDDDRAAMDPLHWLENISERPNDAIEQILNDRQYLQRWMHIVQLGHRSLWFHDIPVTPSRSSVWRINQACNRPNERLIFAQAAFPFLVGKGDDDMDDPFGLTSESVFALEPQEMNVMKTNAAFRVMGVFPAWGWE